MELVTTEVPGLLTEGTLVNVLLQEIEPTEFDWEGETQLKLKWVFLFNDPEVAGDYWNGKEIWGQTSRAFVNHTNCKAMNWAITLTSRAFKDGDKLNTDDLIGISAKAMIGHKTDGQGRTWMRVERLFPSVDAAPATADDLF